MAQQTAQGTQAREGGIEVLTELATADFGSNATLNLYKTGWSPTDGSVYADFDSHKADYTGNSEQGITWDSAGIGADGKPAMASADLFFQATDAVTPNTIAGAYLTIQTATGPPVVRKLAAYYPFLTPVPMTAALAYCTVKLVVNADDLTGYAVVTF